MSWNTRSKSSTSSTKLGNEKKRRCLLCSAVGSKVLDEVTSNILCQEIEEKGQVISCGEDGRPYLSQLDANDTALFCEALQIRIMGEYFQELQPTFCSAKCFQTIAHVTTIQLKLNKLVDEIVVEILESISKEREDVECEETDTVKIFKDRICEKWEWKDTELDLTDLKEKEEPSVLDLKNYEEALSNSDQTFVPNSKMKLRITPKPKLRPRSIRTKRLPQQKQGTDCEQADKETQIKNKPSVYLQNRNPKINIKKIRSKLEMERLVINEPEKLSASNYQCLICNESFKNKKVLQVHSQQIHNETKTKCQICGITFRTKEFYSIHLEHLHSVVTQDYSKISKNEIYKCEYCTKKFQNVSGLRMHQHSHVRKKPAACPVCEKVLSNDIDFYYHKRIHDGPFDCDACTEAFANQYELILHQGQHDNHYGSVQNCIVCGNTFANVSNLEVHSKVHPSIDNSKLFTCKICGQFFGVKYYLHKHLATQHRVPEHVGRFNCLCHLCGKNFALKKVLLVHMRTHSTEYRFSCKHCPEQFLSRHALKQHQASRHEGLLNIFKCKYCQETFTFLIASRRHMVEAHPEHTASEPFSCKVCFKTFSVLPLLEDHSKSHEKLSCKVCGKACGSKRRLEMHESVHSGELKYSCEICGKCFRHDNNVQSHKREQHSDGQRPWVCTHCPAKCYKRKDHLRSHLQKEHGEDLEIRKKKKTIPGINEISVDFTDTLAT